MGFCWKCGAECVKGQPFCRNCGASVVKQQETVTKGKTRGKVLPVLTGFLGGLLLVTIIGIVILLPDKDSTGDTEKSGNAQTTYGSETGQRLENGSASPEEAVTAYLEGLRDADIEKMLSSFAIESWNDNVSHVSYTPTHRENSLHLAEPCRALGALSRYASGTNGIIETYLTLTQEPEYAFDFDICKYPLKAAERAPVKYALDFEKDTEQIAVFADLLRNEKWLAQLATIEIGDFLSRDEFSSMSQSEYEEYCQKVADRNGIDALETVVVEVRMDGYNLYFLMDVACFDGRWYNCKGISICDQTADKIDPDSRFYG